MLSDDELLRLRQLFIDAAIATVPAGDRPASWDNMIFSPRGTTIRAFVVDSSAPMDVKIGVTQVLTAVGYAYAGEILAGVPLPLDEMPDRRWSLRRELVRILEGMSIEQIERTIYAARAIAQ